MSRVIFGSGVARLTAGLLILGCELFALTAALPAGAQEDVQRKTSASTAQSQATNNVGTSQENGIPAGTILPVVLRTSFELDQCKPGQQVHGQIAQNVPLGNGSTIHRGSLIEGRVVDVTPATIGAGTKVSIQFEKLNMKGHWIPVVTNLRAIAGFMTVIEAGVPDEAPAEGAPYQWLPTTQIGGDSVYGMRGPVMSWKVTLRKSLEENLLAMACWRARRLTKARAVGASWKAMTNRRRYGYSQRMRAELMESSTSGISYTGRRRPVERLCWRRKHEERKIEKWRRIASARERSQR